MKIVALICGILASLVAWAASYFVLDLSIEFLELWPETISQQFLGLIVWHGIIALPLVGGLLAIFAPLSGGILMLAGTAVWVWLGMTLPSGLIPQLAVPLGFSALGTLSAFGASIRGLLRRRAEARAGFYDEAEELEREEALRFEPSEDLARAVEVRSRPAERGAPSPDAAAEAIVPVAVDRRRDAPPQGLSGLVVVNALLLLLLTIAVGVLLYSDYRNGDLANAFSSLPPALAAEAGPVAPEEEEVALEPVLTAATEPAAAASDAEVRISSVPLDLAALPSNRWDDPFAYCQAVRTIDYPDYRYGGPAVTQAIAQALRVPASSPPDRVRWRCVEGAVLACASFRGASCAPAPTVPEMMDFCAQNPNAANLAAPGGSWSCDETSPRIPEGQSWPVDARGFLPGAWVEITPPLEVAGG